MVSLSTESVQEWFDDQLDSVAKSDLSNTLNNPDIIGKYFTELDQEQQDLVLGAYLHMAKPDINIPDLEEEIEAGGYSDDSQPNADKGWKSYPAGTSHFESKATEELTDEEKEKMTHQSIKNQFKTKDWDTDSIDKKLIANFPKSHSESKATEVFEFYEDAGHGWLEVPKSLLKELGISDQISNYSYQKGGMVYLEEDADMSLFVSAYGSGGEIGYDSKDGSHIRQFNSYSA